MAASGELIQPRAIFELLQRFPSANRLEQASLIHSRSRMEGLGDGYEAFVERLQMNIAFSSAAKNTNPPPPPQSQLHQARYVGYPSTTNAFTVKREPAPALSDSSHSRTTSSISMEVSIQEAVSSPGHTSAVGSTRLLSPADHFSSDVNQMPDTPPRRGAHRRAQSEIAFRLPDELLFERELGLHSAAEMPTLLDDGEEDLLSMYIDLEKMNKSGETSGFAPGPANPRLDDSSKPPSSHHSRSLSMDGVLAGFNSGESGVGVFGNYGSDTTRPRHYHSSSMDGSTSFNQELLAGDLDSFETKKAMAANKLAELALLDPKRAKRILANRQSAARSKERKMRYISELERKVQTLQTEATTLSAQLTLFQRDTAGLTTENNELRLRLQALEQQAQLRDALNDTLKEELQRLKLATGQLGAANGNAFNLGTQHLPLSQSYFQLSQPSHHLTTQQLQQAQSSIGNQQQSAQAPTHSDILTRKSFGSL